MAASGFVVVASGLAGAALAFVGGRIDEARRERNERVFRNQEERRKTGADYLVSLEAYRRAVLDQRDNKMDESDVAALARAHADLAQRMYVYFDRAVRDHVERAGEAVNAMHESVLTGGGDFERDSNEAKRQRDALVVAIRRQLGEPDD